MLSKKTEVFANSLGLRITENNAYGIYCDYLISVTEKKDKTKIRFSCYLPENDGESLTTLNISDAIKARITDFQILDYEIADDSIELISSAQISNLREMLDFLVNVLKENNVSDAYTCTCCGNTISTVGKRKVVMVDDAAHLMCDSCALEYMEENQNKPKEAEESNPSHTFKGVIGSLVGGLVGAAIYTALFFVMPSSEDLKLMQYLICVIGAVIGVFTFYGYFMFSKKINGKFIATVSLLTAVFTSVAHYIGCVIACVIRYSSFDSFKLIPGTFLKMPLTSSTLMLFTYAGLAVSLCAAAVALVFLIGNNRKNNTEKKTAKISIVTVK